MKNDKVSVVIPCYNDGLYISEAVQSAINQTWGNKEIIIVDDGSDKATKLVLEGLKSRVDLIITQKNCGPSAARNCGIDRACGKYILVLDADDYFEPEFCKMAIELMESHKNVGIVSSHALIKNRNKVIDKIHSKKGNKFDYLIENRSLGNNLLLRACWQDIGGYDEQMLDGYEDWEFNIRVLKYNWKIKIIDSYLFHYKIKPFSHDQKANSQYKYLIKNYIYQKHKDIFIEDFERITSHIHSELHRLEREKEKIRMSLTYRLGNFFISPFRKLWLKLKIMKNNCF